MGAFIDIRAALETKLYDLSPRPSIAWEGVPFAPTPGTAFIRPFLLPGPTVQHEIGTAGLYRHSGIFQVSCFTPSGLGLGAAQTQADAIQALFSRGKLTKNSTTVYINSISIGPSIEEADWVQLPVSVNYYAFSS